MSESQMACGSYIPIQNRAKKVLAPGPRPYGFTVRCHGILRRQPGEEDTLGLERATPRSDVLPAKSYRWTCDGRSPLSLMDCNPQLKDVEIDHECFWFEGHPCGLSTNLDEAQSTSLMSILMFRDLGEVVLMTGLPPLHRSGILLLAMSAAAPFCAQDPACRSRLH
jgi:hypothetical protein